MASQWTEAQLKKCGETPQPKDSKSLSATDIDKLLSDGEHKACISIPSKTSTLHGTFKEQSRISISDIVQFGPNAAAPNPSLMAWTKIWNTGMKVTAHKLFFSSLPHLYYSALFYYLSAVEHEKNQDKNTPTPLETKLSSYAASIRHTASPREAQRLATALEAKLPAKMRELIKPFNDKGVPKRGQTDRINVRVLRCAIYSYLEDGQAEQKKKDLLRTGEKYLMYLDSNDLFLGSKFPALEGQNFLGRVLMDIRLELEVGTKAGSEIPHPLGKGGSKEVAGNASSKAATKHSRGASDVSTRSGSSAQGTSRTSTTPAAKAPGLKRKAASSNDQERPRTRQKNTATTDPDADLYNVTPPPSTGTTMAVDTESPIASKKKRESVSTPASQRKKRGKSKQKSKRTVDDDDDDVPLLGDLEYGPDLPKGEEYEPYQPWTRKTTSRLLAQADRSARAGVSSAIYRVASTSNGFWTT